MQDLTDIGTETIAVDPNLACALRKRFGALSAADWDLTPAQGEDLDREKASLIASVVRSQIESIPDFRQAVEDLDWAHWDGRAALEIHWDRRFTGPVRYQVAELSWIHPRRITFGPERELRVVDTSSYAGNFEIRGLDTRVENKFIRLTPRLFREYPEREGLALRCLYWSNFKRFTARERMILLELYGKPWRIVEHDPEQPQGVDVPDLDEAVDQAEALGSVVVAKFARGLRLRLETPDPKAGELHNHTIEDCDKQILKLVLGGTDSTDSNPQGIGGQTARVHQDGEGLVVSSDGERVNGSFQRDLVCSIVRVNAQCFDLSPFDVIRYAPKFQLRTAPEKDRTAELGRVKTVVDLGIAVAVDEIREISGYRKPRPDEAIVQLVEAPQDDMSARYIPPRAKVIDPSGSEPGPGEYGEPGAAAPPPPAGQKPTAAAPTAALEPASPDEDFALYHGPMGPVVAEVGQLAPTAPSDGVTNFPTAGENLRVSLKNSNFQVFPLSVARTIRTEHPEIWKAGGTALANLQYRKLAPIYERRGVVETDAEEEAVRLREAWATQNQDASDLAGIVAQIKWLVVGTEGLDRMLRAVGFEKARLREVAGLQLDRTPFLLDAIAESTSHTKFQDIDLVIDRPRGFIQYGTAPDGSEWERTYTFDYGFIPSTEGGDGDDLDVFVGPVADAVDAYWILQKRADGSFDEYKLMLGFASEQDAQAGYLAHVPAQYMGSIVRTSVAMIRSLLGLNPEELHLALTPSRALLLTAQPESVNGTPEVIAGARAQRGATQTTKIARALASSVTGLDTAKEIRAALRAAADKIDLAPLAMEIERCKLHAAALGAMDADWEATNEEPIAPAAFTMAGGQKNFVTRPFFEAINSFLSREIVPRSVWDRLTGAAKKKAFSIAGLALKEMLSTAFDELGKSVAKGLGLRSFRKELNARFDSAGWTRINPSHVENVFRTNTMSAYSAGREAQMTQPAVLKARPYWQIMGVHDDRCRATHAAVRGKVLRADDPFWKNVGRPPFGWMCRCKTVSRSQREVDRLGLTITPGSEIKNLPDPGWSSSKI